jgi:competence ComEA-like helix-hairpin-helix protein
VPDTRGARALCWAALAAAALVFAARPGSPGALRLAADTDRCRIEPLAAGGAACDCRRLPMALREVLGLPAPLNRLSAAELERVPELGPSRARAIVAERLRGGDFASLDDLARRVSGVGPKTVDRIRSRLYVAGPDPACGGSGE